MHRSTLAALCATLALGACGTGPDDRDDTEGSMPGSDTSSGPTAGEPTPSGVPGSGTPVARQSLADLAERLGVPETDVAVVAVEAVTWRDGSLGCAEKDMVYTQSLVEGTRVTLEAAGERYEYHAGGSRAPFLCPRPTQ